MRTAGWPTGLVGTACLGMAFAAMALATPVEKVQLCHVPRGHPAKARVITASPKAADFHLRKHPGDQLGPCPPRCTDAGACDDGNPCTNDICTAAGFCDHSPVDCNDGNQCTADVCDPAVGCLNPPEAIGLPCDDGSPCTSGDHCIVERGFAYCQGAAADCGCLAADDPIWNLIGTTENLAPPTCDDNNACTSDDRCSLGVQDQFARCSGVVDEGPCNQCDPQIGPIGLFCASDPDCPSGGFCLDGCCDSPP